jgi:hypothetical protein
MKKEAGKKFQLGMIMFLLLITLGVVLESLRGSWLATGLLIVSLFSLIWVNNTLCRKWFSFDKLQLYKYSWRQFGIICILLSSSYYGQTHEAAPSLGSSGFLAIYAFLGYLLFYLADRYAKKKVLNIALKAVPFSVPFLIFIITALSPLIKSSLTNEQGNVRFMDAASGEVFEVNLKDIEDWHWIMMGFGVYQKDLSLYQETIEQYASGAIDHETFIQETSRIEDSLKASIKDISILAQEIRSSIFRSASLDRIDLARNDFLALAKIKEGTEKADLTTLGIGTELIKQNNSKRQEFIKKYSSICKVRTEVQLSELRNIDLLISETVGILCNLNELDWTFQDFHNKNLTLREFKEKVGHYDSLLVYSFQKCDSLIKDIKKPDHLGAFKEYTNYSDIYGSVLYQRFQVFGSLLESYLHGDQVSYSENYNKYIVLYAKTDSIMNDYLSNFFLQADTTKVK